MSARTLVHMTGGNDDGAGGGGTGPNPGNDGGNRKSVYVIVAPVVVMKFCG